MLDREGYRPNVGIILLNKDKQVFWGRRKGEYSWQFPQGGLSENETLDECMFRELNEELGLFPRHVTIIAKTTDWLHYDVPGNWAKQNSRYRGQKQIWYLLEFTGHDHHINLRHFTHPEFDAWRWISFWEPLGSVVEFKRDVYHQVLHHFAKLLKV